MKIPARKIVRALQSKANHTYPNDETRILWDILTNVDGDINIDINELIAMFYDTQSSIIVEMVGKYASSTELTKFLANTKGLISEKTYQMLDEIKVGRIDKEVSLAVKKSREEKREL